MLSILTVVAGGTLVTTAAYLQANKRQKPLITMLIDRQAPASSLYKRSQQTLRKLKHEMVTPLLHAAEAQINEILPSQMDEAQKAELEAQQLFDLKIAGANVALGIAGTILYPPLLYLSAAGVLYLTYPLFRTIWHELRRTQRSNFFAIFGFFLPAMLLTGYIAETAAGYFFYMLAMWLADKARGRTQREIVTIFDQQPRTVWLLKQEAGEVVEVEIPFANVAVGDVVVVHAGEVIPVDGTVMQGMAGVDQRMLTGESQPVEKMPSDLVFAATMLLSGKIHVRVDKAGSEAVAAQIGEILNRTTRFAESVQLRTLQLSDRLMLPYMGLTMLALPTVGLTKTVALGWTPIVEAMLLAGPLSVVNHLSLASRQGLLVKDGRALELLRQVDTFVFDKTGTLTEDQPHVSAIHVCSHVSEDEILTLAAAAEYRQTHPIARSILLAAEERQLKVPAIQDASYQVGYGLKVMVDQQLVQVGSANFMAVESIAVPQSIQAVQTDCHALGHSLVYVAVDGTLIGAIELQPTIRPEAKAIVQSLKERGYDLYIISGDQKGPTQALAHELGIDHYFAETLPENKADLIAQLQEAGKSVCFVGDGINDAIALKKAQVSISLRGASTVATDTAQIVMMDGTLNQLIPLLDLAEGLENNLTNIILLSTVPSAIIVGGVFFLHFGMHAAIFWYTVGMVGSVTTAVLPMRKVWFERRKEETP